MTTVEQIRIRIKKAPKFYLSKKHQNAVKIIYENNTLPQYKFKKKCIRCKGSRIEGIISDGRLIPCSRCVNIVGARKDWYLYCAKFPELKQFLEEK
ncbi:MAG: hypothetical protein ACFFDN_02425 [Candidatus Hodarchaeota archaeon]